MINLQRVYILYDDWQRCFDSIESCEQGPIAVDCNLTFAIDLQFPIDFHFTFLIF